jgi:hypothetical protein
MTTSIGLYREVIKGLAIMQGPVPSEFICIGYFPDKKSEIVVPLTQELKDYCKSFGLLFKDQ